MGSRDRRGGISDRTLMNSLRLRSLPDLCKLVRHLIGCVKHLIRTQILSTEKQRHVPDWKSWMKNLKLRMGYPDGSLDHKRKKPVRRPHLKLTRHFQKALSCPLSRTRVRSSRKQKGFHRNGCRILSRIQRSMLKPSLSP